MPAYPGVAGATVPAVTGVPVVGLYPGQSCFLFGVPTSTTPPIPPLDDSNITYEEVPAGTASIAVSLAGGVDSHGPAAVAVQIQFDSAPGTFEIDVQEADTDADAFYVTMSATAYQITSVNATTFIARADFSPTGGKFMRLFVKALANDADLIAKLTRLA